VAASRFLLVRYVIGLDIGTVHDRTAAVVAHSEANCNKVGGGATAAPNNHQLNCTSCCLRQAAGLWFG
jgi:hypothetical protein